MRAASPAEALHAPRLGCRPDSREACPAPFRRLHEDCWSRQSSSCRRQRARHASGARTLTRYGRLLGQYRKRRQCSARTGSLVRALGLDRSQSRRGNQRARRERARLFGRGSHVFGLCLYLPERDPKAAVVTPAVQTAAIGPSRASPFRRLLGRSGHARLSP